MSSVLEVASAVGGAVQAADQSYTTMMQSILLFRSQQEVASEHHRAMRRQSIQHHERHAAHSYELHDGTMFQLDGCARKEMMRDLWQQKNEVCQTRMICATLMFGCCFSMVSDGFPQLPSSADGGGGSGSGSAESATATHGGGVTVLSAALMLGVCCLLAAVCMTIAMYRRLSHYDAERTLKRYRLCGHIHQEFWTFYDCQCGRIEGWSLYMLYAGMVCTVVAVLALQALKYMFVYGNLWLVEPILIAIFGAGVIGAAMGQYAFPDATCT